ncbi:DUF4917 family protein [Siccirubricoccus sp. KC 17139]|uniref:DUF4917 family protein n=1 Tax=Siccirubricoccus soli TaxID=2899147 RepID=A0ABT1D1H4_9PROT|nr:DUF4917 family protein [Siccirubricoccus soli]MCO6415165.1 DUF4917 family protein [Siccirubricoccus soli]MCP2681296.1 DUF4917 family protein [Siccirubricoccus soli]
MAKVEVASFETAIRKIDRAKHRHLLLGNGFSIALKPDIFSYGSLYENADFSAAPHVPALFEALRTQDFEIVIRHLQDAATVVEVYRPKLTKLAASLRRDAAAIKDALVAAVARRHPDRPYDIKPAQYAACRSFLARFEHIFTLNYDVLLYWTLMQDKVDDLKLRPDDGFRHPEDDPDQPYVSWQQANSPTVHYLHGALHLFDRGTEITKYTWSKTDIPIVDQIRKALDEDRYPLFVAEGTSASKRARILHNAYLHKALRSFESCCKPAGNALVIFGHSLAENDNHVLRCIASGGMEHVLVGLYGDPRSRANQEAVANANALVKLRNERRGGRFPLSVTFYDAGSVRLWG